MVMIVEVIFPYKDPCNLHTTLDFLWSFGPRMAGSGFGVEEKRGGRGREGDNHYHAQRGG